MDGQSACLFQYYERGKVPGEQRIRQPDKSAGHVRKLKQEVTAVRYEVSNGRNRILTAVFSGVNTREYVNTLCAQTLRTQDHLIINCKFTYNYKIIYLGLNN